MPNQTIPDWLKPLVERADSSGWGTRDITVAKAACERASSCFRDLDDGTCDLIGLLIEEVERLRKLEGTDDHPEHRCERCGGRNTIWYADSDVWNRVAGGWSVLCPICFAELAAEAGVKPTAWRLSIERDDPEISKLRVRLHDLLEKGAEVYAEIKRLKTIVDKLPKTADGVPLVNGMTVFGKRGTSGTVMIAYRTVGLSERPFYSTREAASVAGGE